jgi:hypothetical protein
VINSMFGIFCLVQLFAHSSSLSLFGFEVVVNSSVSNFLCLALNGVAILLLMWALVWDGNGCAFRQMNNVVHFVS